jgi:hypothetical protein
LALPDVERWVLTSYAAIQMRRQISSGEIARGMGL